MQTMRVKTWGKGQGDFVLINADDYDPEIHTALDAVDADEWGNRIPVDVSTARIKGKHIELPYSDEVRNPPAGEVTIHADVESSAAIPADWQEMGWPQLRRLAASLSDTPILNRSDADAAIRAALAKG